MGREGDIDYIGRIGVEIVASIRRAFGTGFLKSFVQPLTCFAACMNSFVCDIACSLAIALISATRRMRIALPSGSKDPEVGVDCVVVRGGVSRHRIPHGKVGPLEILQLQNHIALSIGNGS